MIYKWQDELQILVPKFLDDNMTGNFPSKSLLQDRQVDEVHPTNHIKLFTKAQVAIGLLQDGKYNMAKAAYFYAF